MDGEREQAVDEAALNQALLQALAALEGPRMLIDELEDDGDDDPL